MNKYPIERPGAIYEYDALPNPNHPTHRETLALSAIVFVLLLALLCTGYETYRFIYDSGAEHMRTALMDEMAARNLTFCRGTPNATAPEAYDNLVNPKLYKEEPSVISVER